MFATQKPLRTVRTAKEAVKVEQEFSGAGVVKAPHLLVQDKPFHTSG